METVIHRAIMNIPSHSFNDPEVCPEVHIFDHERILLAQARVYGKKMHRSNKRVVVYKSGAYQRVITLSNPQADCFEFVMLAQKLNSPVFQSVLEAIFAKNTVNSLIKAKLLEDIGNDKLKAN